MCATSISRSTSPAGAAARRGKTLMGWLWLAVALLPAFSSVKLSAEPANAVSTGAPPTNLLDYHRKLFQEAHARFHADPSNATNAWQFGRACFNLAELTTNNTAKAAIAEQAMTACRQALANGPDSAPAHYYLGLNLGEFADTKRNMSALKLVKDMESEFNAARELDEHFDNAGPDRNLGILYFESPTLISIGSRTKARKHLQRAVELAPEFPENRLNLIETLLKWNDQDEAHQELKALEKIWPAAKENPAWKANLTDWQNRLNAARRKIYGDTQ